MFVRVIQGVYFKNSEKFGAVLVTFNANANAADTLLYLTGCPKSRTDISGATALTTYGAAHTTHRLEQIIKAELTD